MHELFANTLNVLRFSKEWYFDSVNYCTQPNLEYYLYTKIYLKLIQIPFLLGIQNVNGAFVKCLLCSEFGDSLARFKILFLTVDLCEKILKIKIYYFANFGVGTQALNSFMFLFINQFILFYVEATTFLLKFIIYNVTIYSLHQIYNLCKSSD